MSLTIRLNPLQQVSLIPEFADLIKRPPDNDVAVRTLSQKLANQQPLIQGHLVIAGKNTLRDFPRTQEYPVHFRKTYYPTSFHPPATLERDKHEKIAAILGLAPPLGATPNSFRSCFLTGIPLSEISPFGVEPEIRNLEVAEKCDSGILIGLWTLLEELHKQLKILHAAGFAHGDLFFHNVIVSKSPIALIMIDFADAIERNPDMSKDDWQELCQADFTELYKHALWVQAGLGAQPDSLGKASLKLASKHLVESADKCIKNIRLHSFL